MDPAGRSRTLHFRPMLAEPQDHAEPEQSPGPQSGAGGRRAAVAPAHSADRRALLAWRTASVDGHRVRYAVVGQGPAALFLHGWGLRPNAYREAIRAMADAGLPCLCARRFPGSAGPPSSRRE